MKFLLVLCLLFVYVNCEEPEAGECFRDYYPESEFEKSTHANNCARLIDGYATEFRDDIIARLKASDDQTCILNTFDSYNVTDLYLKGVGQHLNNRKANQSAYDVDVGESKVALLNAAKVLCTADSKYSEDFDEYFQTSHKQNTSEESHSELCIERYFFDHKIIDAVEYNFDLSTLTATDCDDVIKNLEENFTIEDEDEESNTFFGLSAVKAQDCVTQKFSSDKVLQHLFSFQIIIKFDLTQEQVSRLRSKYIKWMTSSVRFLLECVKEI